MSLACQKAKNVNFMSKIINFMLLKIDEFSAKPCNLD